MALVAIPFALVSPRSGGRAMGIGVAIVIAVGYWVVHSHSIALAFAQADLLPAALAAWTANIVFAGIGTALALLPALPRLPGLLHGGGDRGGHRRRGLAALGRAAGGLLGPPAPAEDAGERRLEGRLHRDLVAVGHHHPAQLGQGALLGGGQVERL